MTVQAPVEELTPPETLDFSEVGPQSVVPIVAPSVTAPEIIAAQGGLEVVAPVVPRTGAQLASAAAQHAQEAQVLNTLGMAEQAKAAQQTAEVEQAQAQAQDAAFGEQQRQVQEYTQKVKPLEEKLNARMGELQNQYQEILDQQKRLASQQVKDPWGPDSNKVVGIIGAMLGGIGAGLTGGPNQFFAQVDNVVAQRIARQRAEADKLERLGQGTMNLYGAVRQRLGDERAAEVAVRQQSLQDLQVMTDRIANKFRSPRAQAAANALKGVLTEKYGEAQQQLQSRFQQAAAQGLALDSQRQQSAFDRQMQLSEINLRNEAAQAKGKERGIPGLEGEAPDEKSLTEARAAETTYQTMMPMLDELQAEVKKSNLGDAALPTKRAKKMQAMASALITEMKDVMGLGVLTGPDLRLVEQMIPSNPAALTEMQVIERLNAARSFVKNRTAAKLALRGFRRPKQK